MVTEQRELRVLYRCNGQKECSKSVGCGITHKNGTCTQTFDAKFANPMYQPIVIDMNGRAPVLNNELLKMRK